jgi:hypothetical protein
MFPQELEEEVHILVGVYRKSRIGQRDAAATKVPKYFLYLVVREMVILAMEMCKTQP